MSSKKWLLEQLLATFFLFVQFLFLFSIPHTKTTFWSSFVGVLSDWCQKMLWFACVRPFFHPFCLHICKYVQHSDGHCRLKKCPKFALPWPTFWPLLVRYDVKTEELKDHMVISVSNWGIRFSSNKGILKGQEISKQNCQAITSLKERTDKIAFLSWWLRN